MAVSEISFSKPYNISYLNPYLLQQFFMAKDARNPVFGFHKPMIFFTLKL